MAGCTERGMACKTQDFTHSREVRVPHWPRAAEPQAEGRETGGEARPSRMTQGKAPIRHGRESGRCTGHGTGQRATVGAVMKRRRRLGRRAGIRKAGTDGATARGAAPRRRLRTASEADEKKLEHKHIGRHKDGQCPASSPRVHHGPGCPDVSRWAVWHCLRRSRKGTLCGTTPRRTIRPSAGGAHVAGLKARWRAWDFCRVGRH